MRPDVVGYSVITGSHQEMIAINRRLKRQVRFLSL
jgi:hypothetical protein